MRTRIVTNSGFSERTQLQTVAVATDLTNTRLKSSEFDMMMLMMMRMLWFNQKQCCSALIGFRVKT